MAFDAGSIRAELAAELDSRGFRAFDSEISKARAKAKDDIAVQAKADVDASSFARARAAMAGLKNESTEFSGSIGRANRNVTFFRNTISLIRWPAIIAGAGGAAQAVSALAGGAAALSGTLGPLAGLLTQYPTLLGALGQSVGTAALAFSGIGGAIKQMSEVQVSAGETAVKSGDQQRQAADQIRSAEESLATAQRSVRFAQEDLTAAREDAARQLVDMRLAAEGTELGERRALLSLQEARQRLRELQRDPEGATDLERRDALLAVREAELNLHQARVESRRSQEDLNEAEREGVRGADPVVSARRALADAQRGVADSSRQLAEAQRSARESMESASTATQNLQQEMAGLPDVAQRFARFLFSLQPQLDALRDSAARGLLPGLERGITSALRNFPRLNAAVSSTSEVLGQLSARAGSMLGGDAFGRDFTRLAETNDRVIRRMGAGVLNLSSALRHVMVAARPLTDWISKSILGWTKWVEQTSRAGRESGKLADFFEETRATTSRLVALIGDFGVGLWNIIRLGKPLGDDLLKALNASAKSFRDWTESARGRNSIRAYFRDIKPPLFEAGRLIRDIVGTFFRLGRTPGLTQFLRAIRTDLLPALENVVATTTKAFGPVLIDFLKEAAELFQTFVGQTGVLTVFVDLLTTAMRVINKIFETIPGSANLAANLVAAGAVMRLVGRIGGGAVVGGAAAAVGGAAAGAGAGRVAAGMGGTFATGAAGGAAASGGIRGALGGLGRFAKLAPRALAGPLAGALAVGQGVDYLVTGGKSSDEIWAEKTEDSIGRVAEEWRDLTDEQKAHLKSAITAYEREGTISHEFAQGIRKDINSIEAARRRHQEARGAEAGVGFAEALARDGKVAKDETSKIIQQLNRIPEGARESAADTMVGMSRELEKLGKLPEGSAKQIRKTIVGTFGDLKLKSIDQAAQMMRGVSRNSAEMQKRVREALEALGLDTNKALKALGVNKVDFQLGDTRIDRPGGPKGAGGMRTYSRGGRISGYSPVDDRTIAVRGGERVLRPEDHVPFIDTLMRMAAGFGLDDYLRGTGAVGYARGGYVARPAADGVIRGYARGGFAQPPGDPGAEVVAGGIARSVGQFLRRFKLDLTAGYDPGGGHVSPGHNITGTALDIIPGIGGSWGAVNAAVKWAVSQGMKVLYSSSTVPGSIDWPNHGPGNHAHVEWGSTTGGPAAVPRIRRPELRGPAPLGDLGRASIEQVHKAANRYVNRKSATAMGPHGAGAGGANVITGGPAMRILSKALRITGHFSPENLRLLYGRMIQESGGNTAAVNEWDSNAAAGTPSMGWLQTIRPTFDAYKMRRFPNILNPLHNAIAAIRYMFARYGHVVGPSGSGYQAGGLAPGGREVRRIDGGWLRETAESFRRRQRKAFRQGVRALPGWGQRLVTQGRGLGKLELPHLGAEIAVPRADRRLAGQTGGMESELGLLSGIDDRLGSYDAQLRRIRGRIAHAEGPRQRLRLVRRFQDVAGRGRPLLGVESEIANRLRLNASVARAQAPIFSGMAAGGRVPAMAAMPSISVRPIVQVTISDPNLAALEPVIDVVIDGKQRESEQRVGRRRQAPTRRAKV